jgi:hypothetical protein
MGPFEAVVAIAVMGSIALSIKAVVSGIVKFQENRLRYSTQTMDSATDARLERIEHAMDAIAIEVERISEGQRFTTRLLSEREKALPG